MTTIFWIIGLALNIYSLLLIIRVFLSWLPNIDRTHPAVQALYDVTEPVLRPVRDVLPATPGLDLSPLVVIIAIQIISRVLGV